MLRRREFLLGSACTTLIGLNSAAVGLTLSPKSVPVSPTPAAPSSPASSAQLKRGCVLNGFCASDFPFKNFMLGAGDMRTDAYAYPAILDNNGYPTSTPATAIAGTIPVPTSYSGRYILSWSGTGRFQLSLGGLANQIIIYSGGNNVIGLGRSTGTVSFNLTVDGTNPEVEFAFQGTLPSRIGFNFPASGTYSGMSNLVLCRSSGSYVGDQAAIKSGVLANCFNADFVAKVKSLNPVALRVMDWIGVNNSDVTQFKYLANPGYLTVSDYRWSKNLWAGTASGTDRYTCNGAPDTPAGWTDGETIQCQFANANTSTPIIGAANNGLGLIRLQLASTAGLNTGQRICVNAYNVSGGQQGGGVWVIKVIDATHIDLISTFGNVSSAFDRAYVSGGTITTATLNVKGRGPKLLTSRFGGKENTSNATGPGIVASAIGTLVYDATLDILMYRPGGLNPGVSLDVVVALANNLNVGLWYCFPHMIDDSGVRSIVSFVASKLNPSVPCYFEYSNEVWNFVFDQTLWATNRGIALKLPSDNGRREYGWYGLRHRQVMELAKSAWGNRPGLNRVLAVMFFSATYANKSYRFEGSDLSSFGYNLSPNRPIDHSDIISYAPYYSGAVLTNGDGNYTSSGLAALVKAADDYASGNETRMASALAWVDADIRAGNRGGAVGGNTLLSFMSSKYPAWEALAATYPKSLICYEGGYEGIAPSANMCAQLGIATSYGGATGAISKLLAGYKNSLLFKLVVTDQMKQFMSFPHSMTSAWYTFGGGIQWSMLPGDLYSTPYKSFDAVAQFNS